MRVLADTHTLVWALAEPERLSSKARNAMAGAEVVVSVASLWELILKAGKKDALLANPVRWWEKNVTAQPIRVLSICVSHVSLLEELPPIHRDPFDRILVAQARVERIPIVSKDLTLAAYGVEVIW